MSSLSITIVIPVLGRESLLPRLFRSLDAVEGEGVEVVLVDNGSTDSSLSLCREYAQGSPCHHVRVFEEPRRGANCARNRGLREVTTEWVYFFDSDDELSPGFLLALAPSLTDDCDALAFPTLMERGGQLRRRDFVAPPTVASQVLSGTLNTQGVLWRTAFLRSIGGWDESLRVWQDWELAVRALARGMRLLCREDEAYHVLHLRQQSITATATVFDRFATLLAVSPLMTTAPERRALYFRLQILKGQSRTQLTLPFRVSAFACLVGSLLRCYVRMGGRGAWRIALFFTQSSRRP